MSRRLQLGQLREVTREERHAVKRLAHARTAPARRGAGAGRRGGAFQRRRRGHRRAARLGAARLGPQCGLSVAASRRGARAGGAGRPAARRTAADRPLRAGGRVRRRRATRSADAGVAVPVLDADVAARAVDGLKYLSVGRPRGRQTGKVSMEETPAS